MNVLLDPEVWDVEKVETLTSQRFNISGKYMVRETALCIERVSSDTEGNWYFELEFKNEPKTAVPHNSNRFPSFQNLVEYMDA
jgi:hypothetical protein